MSLDPEHNKINEFYKKLSKLKVLNPIKSETQLKKKPIMKNVDELYEKYYNAYKNDFDNDDELSEAKKKKVKINSLNCLIKQTKN